MLLGLKYLVKLRGTFLFVANEEGSSFEHGNKTNAEFYWLDLDGVEHSRPLEVFGSVLVNEGQDYLYLRVLHMPDSGDGAAVLEPYEKVIPFFNTAQ